MSASLELDTERQTQRRRNPRRLRLVRQQDETDCGAACLAMVCRHFRRSVGLGRVRQLVSPDARPASLRTLCEAAGKLGLAARAAKITPRQVEKLPLPAILHWEGQHWVVLHEVKRDRVRIADPATGTRVISRDQLERHWTGYVALFDYTESLQDVPEERPKLAWLWPFVRPYLGLMLRALALALVVAVLKMALPVFTQVVVDRVLVEQDRDLLLALSLAMFVVLGITLAAMLLQRYMLSFAAVRIDTAALDYVTRRLLALPVRYFHTRRTGDIQRRIEGARQIREFLLERGVMALGSSTQLAGALALMIVYSPKLTLVFAATLPLYLALMRYSGWRLRPLFAALEADMGTYQSQQIDAIRGIETVKALGAEGGFRERMLDQYHAIARSVFRTDVNVMGYEGAVQTVSLLTIVLMLFVGAHEVMAGAITIGGLVAFNTLVGLTSGPISELLSLWDDYQHSSVLLSRLDDVLEREPEQGADRSALQPVPSLEGHVRLEGVGFRYGGSDSERILHNICLDVPVGSTVGIVGRSGSGKTTLVRCLAGLLEPDQGRILYDGADIRALDQRELRGQIGFVLQENHLFADTIARNIAVGDEDPDPAELVRAARIADADDFIRGLPLGYETPIGESGLALSGGQRQRIAIARALYHAPSIMIFDEATSFLDTESERTVQRGIDELLADTTCFVIAHRLSTIRNADCIIVLDEGEIVEQGTHRELLERDGLYAHLCRQQRED